MSVRKYTRKKHNIFEKNAFLCHVWQTCDTYRNNWSQTCVLQEVYGQTQWTAPAFVQEVCANDAHYATEWVWEKVPEKNSTFFVSRKNFHFFVSIAVNCSRETTAKVDNYAVSRKLCRRLFSFFHKRCTLSHWVSMRKGTEKKHNIFEKNHFHHPHTDTHRHTDTQKSCLFTISLLIHNFVISINY